MIRIMHLRRSYHWSKGSEERIVEDEALGNLAAAGDREESASHHNQGSSQTTRDHSRASLVTPWYHLKLPGSILRTSIFRHFHDFRKVDRYLMGCALHETWG